MQDKKQGGFDSLLLKWENGMVWKPVTEQKMQVTYLAKDCAKVRNE